MKILMVCLGNICRSPLAEGILRKRASEAELPWEIDSAGTASYHAGEPPHLQSQQIAQENSIDISTQQCRQFVAEDMLHFNRIYVMDGDNYREVKRISGSLWDESKVHWMLDDLYPGQHKPVPDPYFGSYRDFEKVYTLLNNACLQIIDNYQQAGR
jgi:protein-tyrosine phosphatase